MHDLAEILAYNLCVGLVAFLFGNWLANIGRKK